MSAPQCCKKNLKLIFIILAVIGLVAAIEIYFDLFRPSAKQPQKIKVDGIYLTTTHDIKPFTLQATNGQAFTQDDLKGHWTFVFFGFTNCGMVCPTSLAALNDMYKMLGKELPAEQLPQIVMISVDPDRDTIERMKDYLASFNPHFLGARADIKETVALENQLHIAAAKITADGQGTQQYTINHTAEILVFNPKGQVQAYLSYPHVAKQMAEDYQQMMKATP